MLKHWYYLLQLALLIAGGFHLLLLVGEKPGEAGGVSVVWPSGLSADSFRQRC